MKIAFAGPSGWGKTTLANYIAERYKLPYIRGSASHIMTEEDKAYLTGLGYTFSGHKEVIAKCASNPDFAMAFQTIVQKRRNELIYREDKFITDRSPVDNIAYFLLEGCQHTTDFFTSSFIQESRRALPELTHLIYIKSVNPGEIEDNKSRIPNRAYQRMVDSVFEHVFQEHVSFQVQNLKFMMIDFWDLEKRKEAIDGFLG